ncbi:2-oxoglutarate and Fe(II)-dependent oxygenase superfamily protein [Prunus dulcis]|uniref:2-oxoglutarate and Fe(II)-dependent oxygenase superfamily protein n=1 Tax=Prunus dulcis TaxID=3755 RepID=A0A4Y1QS08_PRUDU|nr:2-oxoglutarate and Fe(II)-dependent oxygenase superfamily protein [Prunus dulcis]
MWSQLTGRVSAIQKMKMGDPEEAAEHGRRLILHNFLSFQECKELEFIHKSNCTVGYRPHVFSTTLSHLIATNSAHLIMPFVPIRGEGRGILWVQYELFVEFTGLISWSRGSSIGWHSDDNRPYLKQRDFARWTFSLQDGDPATIVPSGGDVVIYTADSHNIHSVDEITDGERLTLALWFSRDATYDEDAKLITLLSKNFLHDNAPELCLPFPASSNMYWFSPDQASSDQQLGFDICWARLHVLGYDQLFHQDKSYCSNISELLMEPLRLTRGDELFEHEFINILHALQVVQFYCWKAPDFKSAKVEETTTVVVLSQSQRERFVCLKSLFAKDVCLVDSVFSNVTFVGSAQHSFNWVDFRIAIAKWEDYVRKLHRELVKVLSVAERRCLERLHLCRTLPKTS